MMKYNITNLDEFKPKFGTIGFAPGVEKTIYKNITEPIQDLIEDKIKELIKPYVDVDKTTNIENTLKENGYSLCCKVDSDYEKYCICEETTGNEDFFLVKAKIEIKQEDNEYTATNYISDIIRGIKQ